MSRVVRPSSWIAVVGWWSAVLLFAILAVLQALALPGLLIGALIDLDTQLVDTIPAARGTCRIEMARGIGGQRFWEVVYEPAGGPARVVLRTFRSRVERGVRHVLCSVPGARLPLTEEQAAALHADDSHLRVTVDVLEPGTTSNRAEALRRLWPLAPLPLLLLVGSILWRTRRHARRGQAGALQGLSAAP